MFTGLIPATGHVSSTQPFAKGREVIITAPPDICNDIGVGDSISINGVCRPAIKKTATTFTVQFLEETLNKTTMGYLIENDTVNLELCLTLQTKLGGHLVSGHIDDRGKIVSFDSNGPWGVLTIQFHESFAPYLIPKGSVAIEGISLTVVDITTNCFTCHLIPHTQTHTNLNTKQVGDMVNLEFDQVGKYLFRFWELNNKKS
ncbi:MAG: riboflavin synthase [Candidatus Marinamargulisbacteria bacterium]